MKILLCLLSGQPTPNLLSVHHVQPDRLVLVESKEMNRRGAADSFLKALAEGGRQFRDRTTVCELASEDDLRSIRSVLMTQREGFPQAEWIVNLTGGTKPMSIGAYDVFERSDARLVYTSLARPSQLIDFRTGSTEDCQHPLGIREFFAAYGFEIEKSDQALAEAAARASKNWDCARTIVERIGGRDLVCVGDRQSKLRSEGGALTREDFRDSRDLLETCVAPSFGLSLDAPVLGRVDKYQGDFLTGGYLEVFVWGLLQRHAAALGIADIKLGATPIGQSVKNELDICFMHQCSLCVVECKSGAQEHQLSPHDFLYKIESVRRPFQALGVKSWLVTNSDVIKDRSGIVKPALELRAALYGCRIIVGAQLEQLARTPDDEALVQSVFFGRSV